MLYGLESLIPKNHYSMHIPEQWLECLMRWFDCWPQERKHRLIIAKAVKVYNTEVYEKSVISRLWHDTYMKWTGDNIDKHFHSAAWSAAELPGRVIRCRRVYRARVTLIQTEWPLRSGECTEPVGRIKTEKMSEEHR